MYAEDYDSSLEYDAHTDHFHDWLRSKEIDPDDLTYEDERGLKLEYHMKFSYIEDRCY